MAASDVTVHSKLDRIAVKLDDQGNRLTIIETQLNVWTRAVIPMLTGFVGTVAGIMLAIFALKG